MNICVTGATGFVGAQMAAKLAAKENGRVRVTWRNRTRLEALAGIDVDLFEADVLDRDAMRNALDGCELLFHAAGMVASRPARAVWDINAVAPRIAVECAADMGVRRVVLTSSVAAIGPAPPGRAADERDPGPPDESGMIYADAKREGERAAFAAGERLGVEVVAVNPAYVLGPPLNRARGAETSTRIVGNYLRGRLPAIVDSYTNIVDVEDVADGHLLAAELGKPGERYILGGQNMRWSVVIEQLAKLSGRHYPVIAMPPEVASGAGLLKRLRVPLVPLEGIRLMAPDWRYSSDKARHELGYSPRSAGETLRRTVDWYVGLLENGAVAQGRLRPFDVMTAGIRVSDRLGLLVPLKAAGRVTGRKLVL